MITSQPHLSPGWGTGQEAQRGAPTCPKSHSQWGQSVPLARVFFHCPCVGAGSQLAAWAWGTRRGGEDPPCLLRGQRPALWNAAARRTQSFHPTWWRGERGQLQACFHLLSACFVPGLMPRPFHTLPVLMPTETPRGESDFPHPSREETRLRKADTCLRSPTWECDSKSPVGQGIRVPPPTCPPQVSCQGPRDPALIAQCVREPGAVAEPSFGPTSHCVTTVGLIAPSGPQRLHL